MFRKTRFKLTAWYLAIIMTVSVCFSISIYNILAGELDRFEHIQQTRIERRLRDSLFLPPEYPPVGFLVDPDLISETQHRIIFTLFIINGCIFVASGILGYILAGRTLKPIKDMLEEQNRFVGDASHELRTPLTSLKSTLEVSLLDKKLTLPEAKNLISESIEEVNKLQSLTDGLLSLLQNPGKNDTANFSGLALADIIAQAIKTTTPMAKKSQVHIDPVIEDVHIMGDPDKLIQLFVILIDNAIKYGPDKQTIRIFSKSASGSVSVSIEDHGNGIPPTDLPHIFDRFYRSDAARTKSGAGGYGLGLSIAKSITDLHTGTIHVESQPGHGSTFTVRLPILSKEGKKTA